MQFEQELHNNIYEPWRFQYVAYATIKRDMAQRYEASGWTDQDESDFERTVRLEADKVEQFITRKQREIDSRVAYCERTLVHQRPNLTSTTANQLYETMDEELTDILIDLNDLSKYTRYNFLAIKHLIEEHDKMTHIERHQLLVDLSRSKPLDKQRFDATLVKISTLHDLCRLHGEARPGNAAEGAEQHAFERATAKYWVHPDNITELKAILLFHLPVLVFNPNKPIEPSDSAISSVYLDNRDFDLYTGRLQRDEGAEAIRFRWYGPMETQNIFIERKTHHAPWLQGASVKDRFRLNADKVDAYLSLCYTADQYIQDLRKSGVTNEETLKMNHFIASGVQNSIDKLLLSPAMRVFYHRTAFQIPGDQRLRISLDTDLTFVREDGHHRRQGNWRRPDMGIDHPFDHLPAQDVYRFPYAVLETKLQTHLGQEPPEWLSRLLESRLVYEVPRFSKYLHGAAHFWGPRLPLLPWWLSEMSLDIRNAKQATGTFSGLSRSKSLKPLIDGRYRMGYLESQLEKRATIKRQPSKTGPPVPRIGRAVQGMVNTPQPLKAETCTVEMAGKNPFDDPFWSRSEVPTLEFEGDSQAYGNPSLRIRTPQSDSRRTTEAGFIDTSSTDYLVEPRQNSTSWMQPSSSQDRIGAPRHDSLLFGAPVVDEKKKNKKPVLEPKIYFANERTFINWLQFSALILMGALTLLNFGDHVSRVAGALFFAIAMGLALYAFARYRYRAWQITNRPRIRYDDLYGPIGLCILFVTALIVNLVLRVQQPPTNATYLGLQNGTQPLNDTAP